jgi:RNA polymerase sigma-70 factor, ECF subfamily
MALEDALAGPSPGRVMLRLTRWLVSAEPDWDSVYAEELPRVYNFFRYRVNNPADAEDLTASTFEKAWVARHRYRRDLAGFSTWLLRIARNVAIDHFRARRLYVPLDEAAHVRTPTTPEDEAALRSDAGRLAALLGRLPDRDRELLALKYGAGMNNRAIARATGLSESNVGTILHRAIQALRADWEPDTRREAPDRRDTGALP